MVSQDGRNSRTLLGHSSGKMLDCVSSFNVSVPFALMRETYAESYMAYLSYFVTKYESIYLKSVVTDKLQASVCRTYRMSTSKADS